MSTVGDLVTIGVVGFVGYKLLMNNEQITPSKQVTVNDVKLPEVTTPNTPLITPDAPLVTEDLTISRLEVSTDPEKQETEIISEMTVPVNSVNTVETIEQLENGQRILTQTKTLNADTRIDPTSVLPINLDAVGGFFGGIADFVGGLFDDRLFRGLKPK